MTRVPRTVASLSTALLAVSLAGACGLAHAAAPAGSAAIQRAPAAPGQPDPRTGGYRVVSRGEKVVHAKCLEGGHVVMPRHPANRHQSQDAAIRDACRNVDYTK